MKVAVVGVGRWGVNHVRVLREIQRSASREVDLEEVVVVDRNLARAREVAGMHGVDKYTNDLEELFTLGVDAAIVAVPTLFHYDVVKKLLPKMDVLVEKPIAAKLEEAEEMGKIAEREGRLLAVGHIERFNPVVPALKERMLEEGGQVIHVFAQRVGPGPAKGYNLNLGVAHDLLVHDVDVVCYLLDSLPSRVYAMAVWEPGQSIESEIVATYSFEDAEVLGEFRASWRAGPRFKKRVISIQLENAVLEADYILQTITLEKGLAEHRSKGEYKDLITAYTSKVKETWNFLGVRREPLLLEDLHFLKCSISGEKPINHWEVGYNALKCVLSALKAAKEGRPVLIRW